MEWIQIVDASEKFFTFLGGAVSIAAAYAGIRKRFFSKISWRAALQDAAAVLFQIEKSGWRPDVIVGLGRSGALWGGWLAGNLGSLPVAVIDRKFVTGGPVREVELVAGNELVSLLRGVYGDDAKILAIEGATTSGQPFLKFNELLRQSRPHSEVRFATLYSSALNPINIEYAARRRVDLSEGMLPWHEKPAYRMFFGAR